MANVSEYEYYEDEYKSFLTTFVIDNRLAYFHYNSFTDQSSKGFLTPESFTLQSFFINNDFDENDNMVFLGLTQISDAANNTSLHSIKLINGLVSENLEIASFQTGVSVSNMFFLSGEGSHNVTVFSIGNVIYFYTYASGLWNLTNQINMTSVPKKIIPGLGQIGIVFSSYFEEAGVKKFYYDIENKTIADEYIQISTAPLTSDPIQLLLMPERLTYLLPEQNSDYIELNDQTLLEFEEKDLEPFTRWQRVDARTVFKPELLVPYPDADGAQEVIDTLNSLSDTQWGNFKNFKVQRLGTLFKEWTFWPRFEGDE